MSAIQALATEPGFENIRKIAERAVAEVFRTNSQNLLLGTSRTPEINKLCEEFRSALKEAGIEEIPETNEELFTQIIRPLHLSQIERSV